MSLKIFFLLIEELKSIENLLKEKIINFVKNNEYSFSDDTNSFKEFEQSEKCENVLNEITEYIKENSIHIQNLFYLFSFIFIFLFKDIIKEIMENLENKKEEKYDNNILKWYYDKLDNLLDEIYDNGNELISLIENLLKLNSLNFTKNAYQNALFVLNIKKMKKKY